MKAITDKLFATLKKLIVVCSFTPTSCSVFFFFNILSDVGNLLKDFVTYVTTGTQIIESLYFNCLLNHFLPAYFQKIFYREDEAKHHINFQT